MPIEEEKVTRKLRAILSADVKGYSILMSADEAFTVKTLKAYRSLMSEQIEHHSGRVVDSPGDNLLAEFSSAVDAVECAVEIQKMLKEKNKDLPIDKRLEFRIGVNIGDVIQDGDRLYGEGVNIAARIEGLADAGGVCISRNAYDHIRNKLKYGYEYLGEHSVKNIDIPVRVYKLLMSDEDAGKLIGDVPKRVAKNWIWATIIVAVAVFAVVGTLVYQNVTKPEYEPAKVEEMAFPLPDKPSIAVLAFDNLSGDPEQEYFSDGMTEDIITALSKIDDLFVIARNSTFTYKGKPVKIKQVAEELGVRYVLEGSVRKSEDRIRINAQLIDAVGGGHLWAERYDRDLKNIFAVQDEITMKIVTALRIELTEGEQARMWGERSPNLDVSLKVMEGLSLWRKGTIEGLNRYGQIGEEIVDMAPEAPSGYIILAVYNWTLAMHGESPQASIEKAFKNAQKAISLGESYAVPHALLGNVYLLMRKYEEAIAAGERAVELEPNGADIHVMLGNTLGYAGRIDEAIGHLNRGIRLNPFPPSWYFLHLGRCYRQNGQYEEALAAYEKAVQRSPEYIHNYISLAAVYVLLGRQDDAAAAAKKVLEIDPHFTIKMASKAWPYKNPADFKIFVDALRKAGLPYEPTLPLPDKPSIAVLAFDNLSGDPEQEYFSDGLSEEIINALSKTDQLFVIARNSSFTYKGKSVNVKQISRELGVRYVLEGSVRKSEDRVRITAQLIDATTGHHLWSDRYDRELRDIFAVQDEITMKIITALQVELTEGEQMRMWAKRYKRLDVQLKAMELLSLWRKGTLESHMRHRQVAQEVVDMAPDQAVGYRGVGWHHWFLAYIGKSPRENLKKAFEMAQKAISLDESDGLSYGLLGSVYSQMRQHEKAIAAGMRSVELDPNVAQVHLLLGQTLNFAGRPDEAIEYLNKAIRLNPFPPYLYFSNIGQSYLLKGQYEKALTEYKKALQLAPMSPPLYVNLAVIYILLNREDEARASAAKALELAPFISVRGVSKTSRYKNPDDLKLITDAMRKAGFPEGA